MKPFILKTKVATQQCYMLRSLLVCLLRRMTIAEFIGRWNRFSDRLCDPKITWKKSFIVLTNTITMSLKMQNLYREIERMEIDHENFMRSIEKRFKNDRESYRENTMGSNRERLRERLRKRLEINCEFVSKSDIADVLEKYSNKTSFSNRMRSIILTAANIEPRESKKIKKIKKIISYLKKKRSPSEFVENILFLEYTSLEELREFCRNDEAMVQKTIALIYNKALFYMIF